MMPCHDHQTQKTKKKKKKKKEELRFNDRLERPLSFFVLWTGALGNKIRALKVNRMDGL
jgi:hypothetical protein